MRVFFDNAATTPLDPAVFEAMKPLFLEHFGNPSSIHFHGREVRSMVERSRKKVADLLNTSPSEIFFTSGGTEADNMALKCSVETLGIEQIITSRTEHHAVLHSCEWLEENGVAIEFVQLDEKGNPDLNHLDKLLQSDAKTLVSMMHANNEIGNLIDLEDVGNLCKENGAYFHSDTVQTMGHLSHDLQHLPVDFIVGSAHKFNGPKGIGFLYINHKTKIHPFISGGAQERNMRGGTENVYGIVGLAKALELAYQHMEAHRKHIESLKIHMIQKLQENIPDVLFNGESANLNKSLYTVLNVSLPPTDNNEMLLFNLDIEGISASGGSACSSGSNVGSHVLTALNASPERPAVRFSFGRDNTIEEVDYVVEKIKDFITVGV
jgi:cysteine desulfurase